MNEPTDLTPDATANSGSMQAALFASLVVQQTNAALMFLGKMPKEEGETAEVQLDHAKLFIDTLEMLAVKTRGNLDKAEERMLQQSLTMLRLAFVELVDQPATPRSSAGGADAPAAAPAVPEAAASPTGPAGAEPAAEDEARKKFVKKY